MPERKWHGASFRDPSGHILTVDGELHRTVSQEYAEHYDRLMTSGLYRAMVDAGQLVAHDEVSTGLAGSDPVHRLLKPQTIPFVSYPWEWCFSQLRDAALLTLDIAWKALDHDMVLKDASAFNVQFVGSKPIFIDTLSFESYVEGEPWVAYRQFCQHFLAPLELIARVHPAMGALSRTHLDGVPLDVADALLPRASHLRPSIMLHIHAHRRAQEKYEDARGSARARSVSKRSQYALLDSLRSAVKSCAWEPRGTEWADYYDATNYGSCSMDDKTRLVREFLGEIAPTMTWDLGANTGRFSGLAVEQGAYTIAFDVDPAAIEKAYRAGREAGEARLLPLVMDLMNATPDLGWDLGERDSFVKRGTPDVVLALALVHHLAIANNVPLPRIARFLSRLAPWLVIEFVPKSDSQVQRMLASRRDIFPAYNREGFEQAFVECYDFERVVPIAECERVIYLMRRRGDGSAGEAPPTPA